MQIDSSRCARSSTPTTLWTLAATVMLAAGVAAYSAPTRAQTATLPSSGTIAVPTYEAAGLYWQNPGGSNGCEVMFRKWGDTTWAKGLDLWYDPRDSQCRGSLVGLTPGTDYQVELNLPGQAATRGLVFKTWSNQFPVARTLAVNGGTSTFNVAEGGSAAGYVVYEGNGATLDGQNNAQYNVTINASYVIVRGLTLKGAKADAIRISPTVTDVIIEDNDISGWGRQRSGNWGVDMDSAVRSVCTQPTLMRVTVQRNRIHNPRYSANSWSDGHPAGPQAIAFAHCGGNHVFRHNEIYSTNGNYFNDIIGGEDNFTKAGFPNSDTDIYGNKLSHAWDDAIEAEGANENVRIWGNYIDRTAIGIATTATSVGPAYIFRNVWNRSQFKEKISSLDADDRQPYFKSGGTLELGHGRRYVFHNTMLQARQSGLAYGLGGGFGLGGTGSTQLIENTLSRNNIYHQWKEGKGFAYQTGSTSSFVADMYNGHAGDATVTSGIVGTPVYASGHGWQSEAGGNYQLASSSPGYGRGARIPNFNDGAATPDVGAHQSGTASMKFGIPASPGSAVTTPSGPPAAPVMGTATAGTGQVSVSFTPGSLNGGVLANHHVTCAASSGPAFNGYGAASPIVVTGLTGGTAYRCWARTITNLGSSPWSNQSNWVTPTTTTGPPAAPVMGTATAGAGQVSVTFTPGNLNGGVLTNHHVTCAAASGPAFNGYGAASPIVVTGLTGGTAYRCWARTITHLGSSPWSAASNYATPTTTVGPPAAPVMGTATAGAGQVSVTLAPGSLNGGTLTHHHVTCTAASGPAYNGYGLASPIVVAGLTSGTAYRCWSRTVTNLGAGAWSGVSNWATPTNGPPSSPVMGMATAGGGQVSVTFTPGSLNGGVLTHHHVTCTASSGPAYNGYGSASPIVVSGLMAGTAYRCWARTVTSLGAGAWSGVSNWATPTP